MSGAAGPLRRSPVVLAMHMQAYYKFPDSVATPQWRLFGPYAIMPHAPESEGGSSWMESQAGFGEPCRLCAFLN